MAILLGHLLTLCAAAMLVGIAFLVRRIPRTGPRRWLMPAWVLVLSLLVLVALLHVYADEAYSLYLTLRGEDFYSIDLATKASPRAVYAILGTIGTLAMAAAIALDLSRARAGSRCPRCAHTLHETQARCPECGTGRSMAAGIDCSRLDVLRARRPFAALLLEGSSAIVVTGAFMAIAVAALPTVRTSSRLDKRPIANEGPRAREAHAEVETVAARLWAPLLVWPGWVFHREIRVRVAAKTERPDTSRDIREDVVTTRIDSVEDYRALLATLDEAPLRNLDCVFMQRYIELCMRSFLELPADLVPQGRERKEWHSLDPNTMWHMQAWSVSFPYERDSYIQSLAVPMSAGALAALVVFWPRRR